MTSMNIIAKGCAHLSRTAAKIAEIIEPHALSHRYQDDPTASSHMGHLNNQGAESYWASRHEGRAGKPERSVAEPARLREEAYRSASDILITALCSFTPPSWYFLGMTQNHA